MSDGGGDTAKYGSVDHDADSGSELGRSYAQALLGAAEAHGHVDAVLDELDELIADVWTDHPQFAELIQSPALPVAEKDRILVEAFENRTEPVVIHFLRVLNRHGRLELLVSVARQARVLWEERQGRRRVTVRSAVALDEQQQAELHPTLAAMTGCSPIVRYELDPTLIGGLVIQVGDVVYDASIRSRLQAMRRRLVQEKAGELQRNREAFTTSL